MQRPKRCKGCIIGILGGLLWALVTYGFTGAVDWTGVLILAILLTFISAIVAHWHICLIR